MESSQVEEFFCTQCGSPVAAEDRFCRHCGAPQGAQPPPAPGGPVKPISERRWFVLVMLFVGLGPMALPMLWRSREFSQKAKIVWTAVVGLVTLLLVVLIWLWVLWIIHQLAPLRNLGRL